MFKRRANKIILRVHERTAVRARAKKNRTALPRERETDGRTLTQRGDSVDARFDPELLPLSPFSFISNALFCNLFLKHTRTPRVYTCPCRSAVCVYIYIYIRVQFTYTYICMHMCPMCLCLCIYMCVCIRVRERREKRETVRHGTARGLPRLTGDCSRLPCQPAGLILDWLSLSLALSTPLSLFSISTSPSSPSTRLFRSFSLPLAHDVRCARAASLALPLLYRLGFPLSNALPFLGAPWHSLFRAVYPSSSLRYR